MSGVSSPSVDFSAEDRLILADLKKIGIVTGIILAILALAYLNMEVTLLFWDGIVRWREKDVPAMS